MAVQTRQQRVEAETTTTPNDSNNGTAEPPQVKSGLTFVGRFGLFMAFPSFVGFGGLYFSYLERIKDPSKELSLDRDFILPFLLALAMVVVLFIQTNGFTSRQIKPLVAWPKVRRVKKVVYKKVPKSTVGSSSGTKKTARAKKEE